MYKFLCESIFVFVLCIYLRVELPSHMLTLCLLTFWPVRLFSKVAAMLYIPISNVWGSQFLYILPNPVIICLFDHSPLSGISVLFWLSFPWLLIMLSVFSHVYWPFIYIFFLFWEIASRFIAHFLVGLSFYYWVIRGLYIILIPIPNPT